jgi:hypothetical protein
LDTVELNGFRPGVTTDLGYLGGGGKGGCQASVMSLAVGFKAAAESTMRVGAGQGSRALSHTRRREWALDREQGKSSGGIWEIMVVAAVLCVPIDDAPPADQLQ